FRHLADSLRRGELCHKDLSPHCTAMVAEHALKVSASLEEGTGPRGMESIPLRDGRTIRQFSTPIQDGADRYFGRFFLFEDITEQKRIRDALAASHAELESRVHDRTAELVRLNRRLRGEICDKEAAQSALSERELRFRTIIENTSDVIFISGADAR